MQAELVKASLTITAKWLDVFVLNGRSGSEAFAEFGALEAHLAEAIVLDHGADFILSTWGAALGPLCGGDRRGHLLSRLPQPSRGQLRRLCVRATASRMPVASQAVWAVEGRIWACMILALPTVVTETGVSRLLLALLFVPHPLFPDLFEENGATRPFTDGGFLAG